MVPVQLDLPALPMMRETYSENENCQHVVKGKDLYFPNQDERRVSLMCPGLIDD